MAADEASAAMTYQIGSSTIRIHVGDLTRSRSQALVSSAGYLLSMGGGVSAAILNAGGQAIWSDARKMVPRSTGTSSSRERAACPLVTSFTPSRSAPGARPSIYRPEPSCVRPRSG